MKRKKPHSLSLLLFFGYFSWFKDLLPGLCENSSNHKLMECKDVKVGSQDVQTSVKEHSSLGMFMWE